MEFDMECKRCRSSVFQTFKRISKDQILVITRCWNRGCKYASASIIPLINIQIGAPSIAWRIEHYGTVCKT